VPLHVLLCSLWLQHTYTSAAAAAGRGLDHCVMAVISAGRV
jgi:hypothetical protein